MTRAEKVWNTVTKFEKQPFDDICKYCGKKFAVGFTQAKVKSLKDGTTLKTQEVIGYIKPQKNSCQKSPDGMHKRLGS